MLTFVGVFKKFTMFKGICKCKKNVNKGYTICDYFYIYIYIVFELLDVHIKVVCIKHAKICNLQIMTRTYKIAYVNIKQCIISK